MVDDREVYSGEEPFLVYKFKNTISKADICYQEETSE